MQGEKIKIIAFFSLSKTLHPVHTCFRDSVHLHQLSINCYQRDSIYTQEKEKNIRSHCLLLQLTMPQVGLPSLLYVTVKRCIVVDASRRRPSVRGQSRSEVRGRMVLVYATRTLNPLTLRRLMSYIYGAPILDVSRSHTTTQHSR